VLASRASWMPDVGWHLLRYADGLTPAVSASFFWQAAADPSRHEQFLLPQPAEPPAEQDYDISELLAAAQLTDTEDDVKINEWRCAICHDGVAKGSQLASAHAPGLANGTLHVFHRQCLEEWRAYSSTCPTCKTELSPRPLPAVWSAGSTRLSARMGVNAGVQNDTRAAARTSNPYVLAVFNKQQAAACCTSSTNGSTPTAGEPRTSAPTLVTPSCSVSTSTSCTALSRASYRTCTSAWCHTGGLKQRSTNPVTSARAGPITRFIATTGTHCNRAR
jgi:hypothetical protein